MSTEEVQHFLNLCYREIYQLRLSHYVLMKLIGLLLVKEGVSEEELNNIVNAFSVEAKDVLDLQDRDTSQRN